MPGQAQKGIQNRMQQLELTILCTVAVCDVCVRGVCVSLAVVCLLCLVPAVHA